MAVERVPIARLKPAEWNPRTLRDSRFQQLCRSIEADPDFLEQRPILAQANGTIFAGNMRYRAVAHLGWESVPAILSDIPEELAKRRALVDNNAFGEYVDLDLSALLSELETGGADLSLLGFEDGELERLLGLVGDGAETSVASAQSEELELRYQIIVECHTEQRQAELLDRFDAEGITCRALMS